MLEPLFVEKKVCFLCGYLLVIYMGQPKILESWRDDRKETHGQFLVDNTVVSKYLR